MVYVTFSDLIGLPKTKTAESAKTIFLLNCHQTLLLPGGWVGETKERGVVVKVWREG